MPSIRALILKKRSYGEGDLIIDILGSQGEKYCLLAKNARQSKKRFTGGVLDPLQFSELGMLERRRGFDLVTEGKVIYAFEALRQSYPKLNLGLYFTKVIDFVTLEGMEENKPLFDLLGNTLRTLEASKDDNVLTVRFQLKLLYYLGLYSPVPELESLTERPISEKWGFSENQNLLFTAQKFANEKLRSLDIPTL